MDAGVGVKAYAVIEQGKIGQILSARPTDRRQLIEEAAGVTKYKSRRRAAELKLEAAQQNLTRVDDIIFEVEKQRGALKRQAAKARRYQRLREELRRWEKVLFAEKYQSLGRAIEAARTALAAARERETAAAAHVAELEASLERLRLELMEADGQPRPRARPRTRASSRSDAASSRSTFDRQQIEQLGRGCARRSTTEVRALEARQRAGAGRARRTPRGGRARPPSSGTKRRGRSPPRNEAYVAAQRQIEGLEADVEAARSEVFAAMNAATALRHAIEHAIAARDRGSPRQLARLEIEVDDLDVEAERAAGERGAASDGLSRAQARRWSTSRRARRPRSGARERPRRARVRARSSFARASTSSRRCWRGCTRSRSSTPPAPSTATAPGRARGIAGRRRPDGIGRRLPRGRSRDTSARSRRVSAICCSTSWCLARRTRPRACSSCANATRAGRLRRRGRARRRSPAARDTGPAPDGRVPLSEVVRVSGPAAGAIQAVLAHAWIARTSPQRGRGARGGSPTDGRCAGRDADGDVFRGAALVEGGSREARGILATKREIKELRERIEGRADRRARSRSELQALDLDDRDSGNDDWLRSRASTIARRRPIVGFELQVGAARTRSRNASRSKQELIADERRSAEEERGRWTRAGRGPAVDRAPRSRAARRRRSADQRAAPAARRTRAVQAQRSHAREAKAAHAALVERASGARCGRPPPRRGRRGSRQRGSSPAAKTRRARSAGAASCFDGIDGVRDAARRGIARLRRAARRVSEPTSSRRVAGRLRRAGRTHPRGSRRALDAVRAEASQLEVARATAEADLTHLASSCLESVQATLDEVAAEVEALEEQGALRQPEADRRPSGRPRRSRRTSRRAGAEHSAEAAAATDRSRERAS